MVAVAYFKNPVNIWVPSSLSKLAMMDVNTKLVSSVDSATYFAKESGMWNDQDEEYDAKAF